MALCSTTNDTNGMIYQVSRTNQCDQMYTIDGSTGDPKLIQHIPQVLKEYFPLKGTQVKLWKNEWRIDKIFSDPFVKRDLGSIWAPKEMRGDGFSVKYESPIVYTTNTTIIE